jgi:hypothetical protein
MSRFPIILDHETGKVHWSTLSGVGKSKLVARDDEIGLLIIHIAGNTSYVDRSVGRKYSPATFQVHRFRSMGMIDNSRERLEVDDLWGWMRWPARAQK